MNTAWAAGFFDGEGCVMVRMPERARGHGRLTVVVCCTDRPALKALQDRWGGSLCEARRNRRPGWSRAWRWSIHAQLALRFLVDIQPHLVLEKNVERVRLAIEYQSSRVARGRRPTPEQVRRMRQIAAEIKRLNTASRARPDIDEVLAA